jgi:hypothetical protein
MFTAVAAVSPALGVSGTAGSGSAVRILSARRTAPVAITNGVQNVVHLTVPAGRWLVTGKLWADSAPLTATLGTTVGCSLLKAGNPAFLDNSIFNVPKATGDTAAGVIYLNAVIRVTTTITIFLRCADFGSEIETHNVVLTAIGG